MVSKNENEQGDFFIKRSSSSLEVSLHMLGDGCVSLKMKSIDKNIFFTKKLQKLYAHLISNISDSYFKEFCWQ